MPASPMMQGPTPSLPSTAGGSGQEHFTTLEGEELAARVTVGERIGGGTSARVYRATFDGQPAALKVLHPHAAQKENSLHEFFKEAHGLHRLQHRCVRDSVLACPPG